MCPKANHQLHKRGPRCPSPVEPYEVACRPLVVCSAGRGPRAHRTLRGYPGGYMLSWHERFNMRHNLSSPVMLEILANHSRWYSQGHQINISTGQLHASARWQVSSFTRDLRSRPDSGLKDFFGSRILDGE